MNWEWIQQRWYWFAGAAVGIWLVSKLLSSGAETSGATVPAGTAITYTGTTANDAAVQVAQLANQSQLAGASIAMQQALGLGAIAAEVQKDTNAANVAVTQTQARAALDIANSNNTAAMRSSDNALTLGLAQTEYAYYLGIDTNRTNLQALEDTNATQLKAYGIQANVANNQIGALRDIAIHTSDNLTNVQLVAIGADERMQADQTALQNKTLDYAHNLIRYNLIRGGTAGTNQIAVWNTAVNPASAASGNAASAAATIADANAPSKIAQIIGSIGSAIAAPIRAVAA